MKDRDQFVIGNKKFTSRFILGSGKYSLNLIESAIKYGQAEIVTLALRRATGGSVENILDYIPDDVTLLPNTSGARTAEEAVRIARLSRECGCGDLVKIEVIRDSKYLLPHNEETIKATRILADEGFTIDHDKPRAPRKFPLQGTQLRDPSQKFHSSPSFSPSGAYKII